MLYNTTPDQLYEPRAAVDPLGYGRVAIVTGCASGIGLACTQLLLAHQFYVCGLDRRPFDYAKLLRATDHGRFHFHQCDLTAPGACDDAVRICHHSFGGTNNLDGHIDVLVNVAGVMDGFASADTVSDAVWDGVLAVNLTVPVRMMRAVLSSMVASSPSSSSSASPGGVIINVASTAGLSGAVAGIAYTASKHGLIGATKNVAWRFRHEGIRCNAVLPGSVDSSIGQAIAGRVEGGLDSAGFAQLAPVHALQARPATAADDGNTTDITALDVAKAIVFLLSDQARSINGVCLPVDKAWGVM
ncbi:short chain dehydrogenase reductase [Grosmannia clavigera kw1407]|uniref:Short chain dehydrogenase reductase n=1 Tax=Grosmannia clavigera (strain kw1407 / UAMH 11150) TaxID=655863 RepID=F0XUQ2_GROCL|nr:short chain dehydrogenase reductase [Grosmannia clavigera kw1407]EFW98493.1 short chain dehydrogenase reductase [Grosmannia clavigera kw1407]